LQYRGGGMVVVGVCVNQQKVQYRGFQLETEGPTMGACCGVSAGTSTGDMRWEKRWENGGSRVIASPDVWQCRISTVRG
jgi:hypothetical protein